MQRLVFGQRGPANAQRPILSHHCCPGNLEPNRKLAAVASVTDGPGVADRDAGVVDEPIVVTGPARPTWRAGRTPGDEPAITPRVRVNVIVVMHVVRAAN